MEMKRGEGWKYRGRGYFQLTGKNNYREYSQYEYGDSRILDNPDRVVSPQDAIKSSIWYWEVKWLNRFADKDDIWGISRAINIGNPNSTATPNGMDDRIAKLRKAKQPIENMMNKLKEKYITQALIDFGLEVEPNIFLVHG